MQRLDLELAKAAAALHDAEDEVIQARRHRDELIIAAHRHGLSDGAIAGLASITPARISTIRRTHARPHVEGH